MRKALLTGVGGVTAAVLGSLCCVGPLLFASFGVGLGLASTFEPLRPLFGVLMVLFIAAAFWNVHGRAVIPRHAASEGEITCAVGEACATPARRRRDVVILWAFTILAVIAWTFPTWSAWLV